MDVKIISNPNLNNKDLNIYRIIPISKLEEIYARNELVFVKPELWKDPFEAHWMKALYPDDWELKSVKKCVFGTCFSKESRSDALWRIYSPKMDGVRIKTSINKLVSQLKENDRSGSVFIGEVEYKKDVELVDFSKSLMPGHFKNEEMMARVWLNKRKGFRHEREIRVMHVSHEMNTGNENSQKFSISPKSLISSIHVDPRLPDNKANELIKRLMDISGMSRSKIRQSDLYKLPKALRERNS